MLLAIVCRNPEVGAVKTRLIPALGAEGARALYRAFLQDLQMRFAHGPHALIWAYTPEGGHLAPSLVTGRQVAQEGSTLSHRLLRLFQWSEQQGFGRTVVMSSDVPHLPLDVIQDAFAALADEDVVLAPSEDGGYHLVGMRRPHDIFTMVEMSTSTVKDETCAAAHRLGLRLRLLQPDFDVDMPDDLQHLAQHLADDEELRTGHTARQLRMLREPPVKTGWK